jgi:hypothetical protein
MFILGQIDDLLVFEYNFDEYFADIQSFEFEDQNLIPAFPHYQLLETLINLENDFVFSQTVLADDCPTIRKHYAELSV